MKKKFRSMKNLFHVVSLVAGISAFWFWLMAGGMASGQTDEGGRKFRVLSWDAVITDLHYIKNDGSPVALTILPNVRSRFFTHTGDRPLVFAREQRNAENKSIYLPVATIPANKLYPKTLLLLFPSAKTPGGYQIVAMNDGNETIPPGGYCFYNFSTAQLQVDCGGQKVLVPSKKSATLKGKPEKGGEIQRIEIYGLTETGPIRVFANRWPYGASTRTLVMMYRSEETGSFELKRLHEDTAAASKDS